MFFIPAAEMEIRLKPEFTQQIIEKDICILIYAVIGDVSYFYK